MTDDPVLLINPLAESPPYNPDISVRKTLIVLAQQLHAALLSKDKLPSEVAAESGIATDLLEKVAFGRAADLTVAQLFEVAKVLGVILVIGFAPPRAAAPVASAITANRGESLIAPSTQS